MSDLFQKLKEANLPKLYTYANKKPSEVPVALKLTIPNNVYAWYITEAQETEDGDILLYGYVTAYENEWGYSSAQELAAVNVNGHHIYIDESYGEHTIEDVMNGKC